MASDAFETPSRCLSSSPTRSAFAMIVSAGFTAAAASRRWCGFVAPTMGAVTTGLLGTQAHLQHLAGGFGVGADALKLGAVGAGLGGGWISVGLASLGVVVTMLGIMLPSSILTYTATRWAHQHREKIGIRAFKSGMAPIVIALLLATSWLLTLSHNQPARDWPLYVLTAVTTLVVWRTKVHMLWLIGAGALLGALGWV